MFRKSGLKHLYPRLGGFWYSLYKREPMQPSQWAGLFLLLAAFVFMFVGLLYGRWPEGAAPWWQKVQRGYGVYAVLGAVIALAIVIPNQRRKAPLVAILVFLLGLLTYLLGQQFPLFKR